MTDPIECFEFVLKNQCRKKSVALYNDTKHEDEQILKPLDVISSVSAQLKAIQGADTFKERKNSKSLNKYKKSTFLCVNNLPVYEEPPKPVTKFDTQCVTDTQLINIIEVAENIDAHQGMTQEFETTFCHINTEKEAEPLKEKDKDINDSEIVTDRLQSNIEYKRENNNLEQKNTDVNTIHEATSNIFNLDETDNVEQKNIDNKVKDSRHSSSTMSEVDTRVCNMDNRIQSKDIQSNIVEKLAKIVSRNIEEHLGSTRKDTVCDTETVNNVIVIDKDTNFELKENIEEVNIQTEIMSQILKPKIVTNPTHNDKAFEIDMEPDFEQIEVIQENNTEMRLFSQILKPKVVKTPLYDDNKAIEIDKEDNFESIKNTEGNDTQAGVMSQILKPKSVTKPFFDDTKVPKMDVETNLVAIELIEEDNTQVDLSQILLKTVAKPIHVDNKTHLETKLIKHDDNYPEIEDLLSQILPTKPYVTINDAAISKDIKYVDENYTQFKENSQILNQCIEICDDDNTERPPSPIFINRNIKKEAVKSKSPSPLVFNLDKFEHFESIAIPLMESNDFDTAKHIINSQLLDKELCIQMDENIELIANDIHEQTLEQETVEIQPLESPITNTDIEMIDKALSEQILNELKDQRSEASAKLKDGSIDMFKDEILFSSDEEEDNKHKEYQDLPFTCALETSFYDQSDVLDKTMYVGFQTASNRSIQVCTGSFVRAKSILDDVGNDEISLTELVKNCEISMKDRSEIEQAKIDPNDKENQTNLVKMDIAEAKLNTVDQDISNESQDKPSSLKSIGKNPLSQENANFMGFITANNKKISLSEKALARCKKVFQNIDINENFDDHNDGIQEKEVDKEASIKKYKDTAQITAENMNPVDDGQCIDDEIIQEFENIEMSLEDGNQTEKDTLTLDIVKDILNGIDFEDLKENKNPDREKIEQSQIITHTSPVNVTKLDVGFKTASNKNIDISTEALAKSKHVFQDLDAVKLPNKGEKQADKIKTSNLSQPSTSFKAASNVDMFVLDVGQVKSKTHDFGTINSTELLDVNQPSTSKGFAGFKTANYKNIKISKKAWSSTKHIFDDLDSADFPQKYNKDYPKQSENRIEDKHFNNFVGFKTANNKNIQVSKEALAKTKNVFDNIDSNDFVIPKKDSKDLGNKETNNQNKVAVSDKTIVQTENTFIDVQDFESEFTKDLVEDITPVELEIHKTRQPLPPANANIGFTTASNKKIKISSDALVKTRNIFKDIDSFDLKVPDKVVKDPYPDVNKPTKIALLKENFETEKEQDLKVPSFQGFKTASNKHVKISAEALMKSKNIFKDIEDSDTNFKNSVSEKQPYYPNDKDEIETKPNSPVFKGFQTANKKPVTVSVKALERSKQLFNELQETGENREPVGFFGFQTASKGEVKISKGALAKSRKIFKDIENMNIENKKEEKSFYPKEILQDKIEVTEEVGFSGFQSASNKEVKISEDALIKSRNIFKDIDDISTENRIQVSLAQEKDEPKQVGFLGFQTASNKQVNVSNEALAKTRQIFKDIDDITTENTIQGKSLYPGVLQEKNVIERSGFSGFQTASNKEVKISKDALAKSRKIFKDVDNIASENKKKEKPLYPDEILQEKDVIIDDKNVLSETEDTLTNTIFQGFHTASKKPVTISREALENSKKLFQDIKEIDQEIATFSCFQTANDKEVIVSDKALTETKKLLDIDKPNCQSFKGFHTASNKNVNISAVALAKSKKIFQDFDDEVIKHDAKKPNLGFQTGNNKAIDVSDEALAKSKRLFSKIDGNINISNKKDKKNATEPKKIEESLAIDTQVLNNFEESLHTEDFRETPIKSKRSGSPILSCPRAKRRKKFETPYTTKNIPKLILKPTEIIKTEKKITFRNDYKKTKKYSLKDIANKTKSTTAEIDPYLQDFTFDNLLQFQFKNYRNDLTENVMSIDLLKEYFLNSVNAKLLPEGWLDNHIKLILWKLISYEVKFKSVICTAQTVADQLKYRYDKELYNVQRSALRKIFEKDDVPSRTLVLCVVAIYADGSQVISVTNTISNIELLLTDGWYCIRCVTDRMLTQQCYDNKITVGSKIVTSGAEVTGCEQGVSPWEDTSSIRLKIYGNSTRRARWDARLGYHGNAAILSQLSSVKVVGGKVCKLRVYITRLYPPLYVEKFEDGSTVTRSERLENIHQMKTEAERQAFMEKLYEEVEREFADQSQDSEGLPDSLKRSCLDSGSQIAKMMKRSKDPAEFRAHLTASQSHLLEAHTSRTREQLLLSIQARVRERIEKESVFANRNVVSLLNIRVAGVEDKNGEVVVTKGMMSIWKPNDAIRDLIKEGAWIDVMNVIPTAIRNSEIQISAGRQSVFSTSKFKEPENFKPFTKILQRQCYSVKDLSAHPTMTTDYNEVDTVGLIFLIDPSMQEFDSSKQSFQNVFLTDIDKNIICVNFWGGLKKFGFQNVLDTGQFVSCVNLQKRAGNSRKSIPQYRVTEFSYFTQSPRNENSKKMLEQLIKKFSSLDRRKFCQDCIVLKNNYSVVRQNNENISPYRFMNTDINMSKNKIFVDSPLARQNKFDDFNLTGLDFESSFKQDSDLSEEALRRKRKVNEKIARLKMYGEPPPLCPIHIINRSKQACNSFKSPLANSSNTPKNKEISNFKIKSDSSINVASVKNTFQNSGELDSDSNRPVLLNRTYVKVNPVKINFDVKDNNDSNIDHFAEDFDGSPPLSLD